MIKEDYNASPFAGMQKSSPFSLATRIYTGGITSSRRAKWHLIQVAKKCLHQNFWLVNVRCFLQLPGHFYDQRRQ